MKNLREIDVSGGLALDTFDAAKKGSKRPVIVPGNADKSLLYELLVTTDVKKRMPLDAEPVSKEKIALIKKWIDSGAKEGTPPLEVALVPAKKAAMRKLDVVISTTTTPHLGMQIGLKVTGTRD